MTKITESCGCVFCDLGLEPDNEIDGRPAHTHQTRGLGYSFCTHPAVMEAANDRLIARSKIISEKRGL